MSGKRQPVEVLQANGRKHLTNEEIEQRLDQEVHISAPDAVVPPKWLLKKHHAEFIEIGTILLNAGLYTDLDRDILAQYFVCRDGWIKAEKHAAKAIREHNGESAKTWSGVQASYFKQARQCGEALGLSVTSRCRLVIPAAMAPAESNDDEFTAILRKRQQAAVNG